MEQRLEIIEQRLGNIETLLKQLVEKNGNIEEKITTHIEFIEATYNVLKSPLEFVTNRIEYFRSPKTLPDIKK